MSSSARTPQTRSQTKRTGTTTTRTLPVGAQANALLETLKDPIVWTTTITVGVLAVAVNVFASVHKNIIKVPKLNQFPDRVVYTLQQNTISMIPLMVALFHVMLVRFATKARNPLSGSEKLVDKQVRIWNNSLEQFILSIVNQLILVTFLQTDHLFIIPFIVYTFTISRFMFIIGYHIHPSYRTPGFVGTFIPTFVVFIVNLLHAAGLHGKILPAI